jgi:acyl carrier protein
MTPLPTRVLAIVKRELAAAHLFTEPAEITPESDLSLDPLDRLCIAVALEEEFGIELSDGEVEAWESAGGIIASVRARVGEVV